MDKSHIHTQPCSTYVNRKCIYGQIQTKQAFVAQKLDFSAEETGDTGQKYLKTLDYAQKVNIIMY